jgi:hypothetical protein
MYIKVFQFGVCTYDLLVLDRTNVVNNLFRGGMLSTPEKMAQLAFGLLLLFIGQVLNYAVFEALGAKGVYYGYEFGYPVSRVYCFPYNLRISDPQYWGRYMCFHPSCSLTIVCCISLHSHLLFSICQVWSCLSSAYTSLWDQPHL